MKTYLLRSLTNGTTRILHNCTGAELILKKCSLNFGKCKHDYEIKITYDNSVTEYFDYDMFEIFELIDLKLPKKP